MQKICYFQYEHTHRRHGNIEEPPDWLSPLTLTAGLKGEGYETALIGKGHLGVNWPRDQFDYYKFSFMTDALPGERLTCDYYRYLVEKGFDVMKRA